MSHRDRITIRDHVTLKQSTCGEYTGQTVGNAGDYGPSWYETTGNPGD